MACSCSQLGGYVGEFDVRDPGSYTLQVQVGWFFANVEVDSGVTPLLVGSHSGHEVTACSMQRSLVDGGSAVGVILDRDLGTLPRFGNEKCYGGGSAGRWIDLMSVGGQCKPPYCSSSSDAVYHDCDWVCHACMRLSVRV